MPLSPPPNTHTHFVLSPCVSPAQGHQLPGTQSCLIPWDNPLPPSLLNLAVTAGLFCAPYVLACIRSSWHDSFPPPTSEVCDFAFKNTLVITEFLESEAWSM